MIALAFGLLWVGYGIGLTGFVWVRGYNLSGSQIFSPTGYYTGDWPPQKAGNLVIIPNGTPAAAESAAVTTADTTTADGTANATGPATASSIANSAIINQLAKTFGWGSGAQWNALTTLIAHESGGNPLARNSSSGALGIAQALGHGTGCSAGTLGNEYGPQYGLNCAQAKAANSGNAVQQIRWMLGYIKARYGTPANAWAQYYNHPGGVGWY